MSDRAHLVLPYHKLLDAASEKSQNIGTTGRGIGPAYEDKYGRRGIRVADLRHLDCARRAAGRPGRARQPAARADGERGARLARRSTRRCSSGWRRGCCRSPPTPDCWCTGRCATGKRVLLEGAQGALLDVDHGTYPYVTSSNTTAGGAAVGAGIGPTAIDGVLGVVKAYTTRVGNGPLPTEAETGDEERLRELGGEFGAVTGRPRRCGWFDATVVRYAVRVNGLTGLAVTKLDVLDTFDRDPGLHRLPARRRVVRGDAGRGATRSSGCGRSTRCCRAGGSRPAAAGGWPICRRRRGPTSTGCEDAVRRADPLRERRHQAGPDHRGLLAFEARWKRPIFSSSAPGPAAWRRASRPGRPGCPASWWIGGTIVSTIERYPLAMTFFSTPERIEIGGDSLHREPREAHPAGRACSTTGAWRSTTGSTSGPEEEVLRRDPGARRPVPRRGRAAARPEDLPGAGAVVFATGYYDNPNFMGVPGEELPHVAHYFVEGHPYWHRRVIVIGAGNSSVDAALECWRAGAMVTLVHFGEGFDRTVKAWVLPDITNRVKEGSIGVRWRSRVRAITPTEVEVVSDETGKVERHPGRCGACDDRLPRGHGACSDAWACRWIQRPGCPPTTRRR